MSASVKLEPITGTEPPTVPTDTMTQSADRSAHLLRWLPIVGAVAHSVIVVRMFGSGGLLSRDPITYGDWSIKFTEAYLVSRSGELPWKTWVYSADHLAGYPAGVYTGVGTQVYDLVLLATRGLLPAPVAFRLLLFVLFLLPPFLPAVAVWLAGFPRRTRAVAVVLGLVVWHLESHVQYMWTFGTTAFLTGSGIALCAAVLYSRGMTTGAESIPRTLGRGVAIGTLAAVATTFHPLCGFLLFSLCLWPLLRGLVQFHGRFWLANLPAGAVFLVLNAHWLVPFFALRVEGYVGGAPGPFATGIPYLIFDILSDRSFRHPFDSTVILQAVGFLAVIGLVWWPGSAGDRRQWIVGLVAVLGITYLGSYVEFFAGLQPYRFLASAIIIGCLPAAVGAERVLVEIVAGKVRSWLLLLGVLLLVLPRLFLPILQAVSMVPLVGITPDERRLFDWVGSSTDRQSRIMFAPDLATLPNLLPWYLDRETIGGPYDHVPLAQRYCQLGRKISTDPLVSWFGKPADDLTGPEVEERLRVLNVEWFVVKGGSRWEKFAAQFPESFRQAARFGELAVYRVAKCERSFFLIGTGAVQAAPNLLRLTGLKPGKITLKYHFLSTLAADQKVTLGRESVLGDPVGFITLDNPGFDEIVIRNTYRLP